ncbi:hypothetical protein V9P72_000420 [Yersinia enterocolitica]|nr:hypothetical protein [Yersinia enterocolitica]
MSDSLEEIVLLERIDLIARLTTGDERQKNDKEIALVWISELVQQMACSYSEQKKITSNSDDSDFDGPTKRLK